MPEPCKTLSEALVALQAQLPRIPKTDEAQVGTRTYRYANLATITDLLMPIMSAVGLAWSCMPTLGMGGQLVLMYRLVHGPSGEELVGEYPLPSTGSPQQIGSAITYARRYALTAVTGIAPADDDDDAAAAERAAQSDAERAAAGRMTKDQQREHEALRRLESPRKADRGPAADDPWADHPPEHWITVTPENKPGTSNSKQHQVLGILYGKLGITERESRLTDMTDRVGRTITSAKDLSYVEASKAIGQLTELAESEH